jgi:hypothetical protein
VRGDLKEDSDGFVMLGGVNISTYCKSTLWNFTLHSNDFKPKAKVKKVSLDEIKVRDSLFGTGIYDSRPVLSSRHALFIHGVRSIVHGIETFYKQDTTADNFSY